MMEMKAKRSRQLPNSKRGDDGGDEIEEALRGELDPNRKWTEGRRVLFSSFCVVSFVPQVLPVAASAAETKNKWDFGGKEWDKDTALPCTPHSQGGALWKVGQAAQLLASITDIVTKIAIVFTSGGGG